MAEPNLPSFFSPGTPKSGRARFLHYLAALNQRRELYRFVCEGQPLLTVVSHGVPKRCPFCGQNYPVKTTA